MPSQKVLETKKEVVAALVADFKKAKSFVFVDARGLTVLQDTAMRAELRKNKLTYTVVKNTTSTLVFKKLGVKGLDDFFKGPTAIAFSQEDMIAPAKFMKQYADKFEKLSIKGGILEGKAISTADVNAVALIPSKEVLYGQIVYGLISPIAKLAMLLNAIAEKAEAAGAKTAAAVAVSSDAAAQ